MVGATWGWNPLEHNRLEWYEEETVVTWTELAASRERHGCQVSVRCK
jgi:hypothetical protein